MSLPIFPLCPFCGHRLIGFVEQIEKRPVEYCVICANHSCTCEAAKKGWRGETWQEALDKLPGK